MKMNGSMAPKNNHPLFLRATVISRFALNEQEDKDETSARSEDEKEERQQSEKEEPPTSVSEKANGKRKKPSYNSVPSFKSSV